MNATGLTARIMSMFIVSLLLGGTALAQAPAGGEPGRFPPVLPREVSVIQKTSALALRRIAQARAAIHQKELARARTELDEAARLARSIRDNLSTAMARDLIGVARSHLGFVAPREALRDLPPIERALDAIDPIIPTERARRHLDRARTALERNDAKGAGRELKLADGSLVTLDVELPLLKVEKYLLTARDSLAKGYAGVADKALAVAERQLGHLFAGTADPLAMARTDLWLAFRNYAAARPAEARSYLDLARADLKRAALTAPARDRGELERLSDDAWGLAGRLNAGDTGSELMVRSVWERAEALAERSAEYLAADVEGAETTLGGENNLIEAKLHVAYAETYQVTTGEPARAADELGKAHAYLVKALGSPLAGPSARAEMKKLDAAILDLKKLPDARDAAVQDRYEEVATRLGELIRSL